MPGIPANLWGASPLYENEILYGKALYQMSTPIGKVLDEGGHRRAALVGGAATNRGKEARECVRKRRVCSLPTETTKGGLRHPDTLPSKLRGYEQKLDTRPVRPGESANLERNHLVRADW